MNAYGNMMFIGNDNYTPNIKIFYKWNQKMVKGKIKLQWFINKWYKTDEL